MDDTQIPVLTEFYPKDTSLDGQCDRFTRWTDTDTGVVTDERCPNPARLYRSNQPCNCGSPECDAGPCIILLCDACAEEHRLTRPFITLTLAEAS